MPPKAFFASVQGNAVLHWNQCLGTMYGPRGLHPKNSRESRIAPGEWAMNVLRRQGAGPLKFYERAAKHRGKAESASNRLNLVSISVSKIGENADKNGPKT